MPLAVGLFDLTQAVLVTMDVRVFNESLGLFKDASNNQVLSTTFANGAFEVDSLSWSRADWIANVPVSQIVSVGHYHSLYTDWIFFCNAYFGYPNGFNSLFTAPSTLDLSGGYFGAERLRRLFLLTLDDMSGNHVQGLSATLTFSQVNAALQEAVRTNPFGNRNPMTSSVGDGFLDGDLVVFDPGVEVTLFLRLVPTYTATVPPTTDVSNIVWPSPNQAAALAHDFTSTHYSQTTVLEGNFIKRTLKVPLVVQLKNISTVPLFDRNNVVQVSLGLHVHGVSLESLPAVVSATDQEIVSFSVTQLFNDVVEASDLSFAALEWIEHATTTTAAATTTTRATRAISAIREIREIRAMRMFRAASRDATLYDLSCNLQCFCLMDRYEGKYASPAVLVQRVEDFLFAQTKEVLTARFVESVTYYLSTNTATIPEGTCDYWTTPADVTLSFVDASLCYVAPTADPLADVDVV